MPNTPTKKKIKQTGTHQKSQMIRVDADFADWVRGIAKKEGTSVTEVTRMLYESEH